MTEQDRYRHVYEEEELCEDCHGDTRDHVAGYSPFSDALLARCHEPTCRLPEWTKEPCIEHIMERYG